MKYHGMRISSRLAFQSMLKAWRCTRSKILRVPICLRLRRAFIDIVRDKHSPRLPRAALRQWPYWWAFHDAIDIELRLIAATAEKQEAINRWHAHSFHHHGKASDDGENNFAAGSGIIMSMSCLCMRAVQWPITYINDDLTAYFLPLI